MFLLLIAVAALSVLSLGLIVYIINKQVINGSCGSFVCLAGKTALVTGGNAGIGYQVALNLAARGCRVIIADKDNADESVRRIVAETHNGAVVARPLDLSSFAAVRRFAEELRAAERRLDILVNNAGVGSADAAATADGLNPVLQVNVLGPFLLTVLLLDLMRRSGSGRIVFTSSLLAFTHNFTLDRLTQPLRRGVCHSFRAYSNSKLCTIILARKLAEKLDGCGILCNAVHPGSTNTQIFKKSFASFGACKSAPVMLLAGLFSKTLQEGAQTTLHAAICNETAGISGKFYSDCRQFWVPALAKDEEFCSKVWTTVQDIVKLDKDERI